MRLAIATCLSLLLATFASAQPTVTAKSAIVIEATSGVVLYQKDATATRFPASTTKIMTALLLLENTQPGDSITAPADTESVTGSSLYMKPGEKIGREDALYALLLRSANDVAHAVAVKVSGSDAAFAKLMNERAGQLGCKNTHFDNPHGLNDDKHSTCAADLALIAKEAMKNPEFQVAARSKSFVVTRSINTQDTLLRSKNRLLKADPCVEGIKTGYTVPAGHCFVGCRELNGFKIITVVLASKDWVADTKALFSWAHSQYHVEGMLRKGAVVATATPDGGGDQVVRAQMSDDMPLIACKNKAGKPVEFRVDKLSVPVHVGQIIGEAVLEVPGGIRHSVPLLAANAVSVSVASAMSVPPSIFWVATVVGAMVFAGRKLRRNVRTTP